MMLNNQINIVHHDNDVILSHKINIVQRQSLLYVSPINKTTKQQTNTYQEEVTYQCQTTFKQPIN